MRDRSISVTEIALRAKYRKGGRVYKKTPYRPRTGPKCCTANCPAKKANRGVQKFGGFKA
jgi:hypothetical protein